MLRTSLFIALCVCEWSRGQTYTWVGLGADERWSTAANWAGGVVPVSSASSRIELIEPSGTPSPGSVRQDLPAGFEIGELVVGGLQSFYGNAIRVHRSLQIDAAWGGYRPFYPQLPPTRLADGAIVRSLDMPHTPGSMFGVSPPVIDDLYAEGTLTIGGGVRIYGFRCAGPLTTAAGSLLSLDRTGNAGDPLLGDFVARGTVDFGRTLRLKPGAVTDLSQAVLDLGRNDATLGLYAAREATIEGDVKLGAWAVAGNGEISSRPVDRLNVTGRLDLTSAHLLPDLYVYIDLYSVAFAGLPMPDYVTLASYDARSGVLPQQSVHVVTGVSGGLLRAEFDAPIIYTSPENAGPGEIRLILPEPGAIALFGVAATLSLTRRRS